MGGVGRAPAILRTRKMREAESIAQTAITTDMITCAREAVSLTEHMMQHSTQRATRSMQRARDDSPMTLACTPNCSPREHASLPPRYCAYMTFSSVHPMPAHLPGAGPGPQPAAAPPPLVLSGHAASLTPY